MYVENLLLCMLGKFLNVIVVFVFVMWTMDKTVASFRLRHQSQRLLRLRRSFTMTGYRTQKMDLLNADISPSLSILARDARGLAIDTISKSRSGHLGLPLGCAEIGAMLWGKHLSYHPDHPEWINRDRFVLSAGHGSMFLYAWLHLSGYALPLQELQQFRQADSMTPGHPEYFPSYLLSQINCELSNKNTSGNSNLGHLQKNTPGVEATTGPLGAGIGNAVGMALAAKAAAAKYNTAEYEILDHKIIALCGDGCLQEGVSFEALSFAGHEKLNNLIVIYDANEVTLDSMASFTQSEDHLQRMQALNWHTIYVENGHDFQQLDSALMAAKSYDNNPEQKPVFIMVKTVIGKGISMIENVTAAHGETGIKYQKEAREFLGLPSDELFHVSSQTKEFFQRHRQYLTQKYDNWLTTFHHWERSHPALALELSQAKSSSSPTIDALFEAIPTYSPEKHVATRQSASEIIQHLAYTLPNYLSGAADLHSSTKNYLQGYGNFGNPQIPGKDGYSGRNLHFGIREHGMGTIMNGIAYYGLHRISGATFLVFADYMRAAMRVAALSHLPVTYILTHDSVGVGEDGPTHQPVETLASLRVIPNLDVIRPADPEEVAGAFVASIQRLSGPTAIVLSRQTVPTLSEFSSQERREGVLRGGYILLQEKTHVGYPSMILIATGSEVSIAVAAAKALGDNVRVVSMPCIERFERQSENYKTKVLPEQVTKILAIEAGVTHHWYKYVGLTGKVVGVDEFGFSAPGDIVMKSFGITVENVITVAKSMI